LFTLSLPGTADANCPEVDGLNVQFPYEHEECHGCGMC
jgi:hypothetical protein